MTSITLLESIFQKIVPPGAQRNALAGLVQSCHDATEGTHFKFTSIRKCVEEYEEEGDDVLREVWLLLGSEAVVYGLAPETWFLVNGEAPDETNFDFIEPDVSEVPDSELFSWLHKLFLMDRTIRKAGPDRDWKAWREFLEAIIRGEGLRFEVFEDERAAQEETMKLMESLFIPWRVVDEDDWMDEIVIAWKGN